MSTYDRAQHFAELVDRTDGELDAAILAHRQNPTPENLARALAAGRAHHEHYLAEQTDEYIARTK